MQLDPERRHHKRFDMTSRKCRLSLIRRTDTGLALDDCALINLSYAGMGFRTSQRLLEHEGYQFILDLGLPVAGLALVKAQVRWVERLPGPECRAGAAFLESNLGWLEPEENDY